MVKIETVDGKKVEVVFKDDHVIVEGKEYSYQEIIKILSQNLNSENND